MKKVIIYYGGLRARAAGGFKHALLCDTEFRRRGWEVKIISLDDLPILIRYIPIALERIYNFFDAPLGYIYRGKLTRLFYKYFIVNRASLRIFEEIYISWNSNVPTITMLHATWSDNLQAYKIKDAKVTKLIRCEADIINNIKHPLATVSIPYLRFLVDDLFAGMIQRNIVVIPLATEIPDIDTNHRKKNSLVYCGTVEERKNLRLLLSVFEKIKELDDSYTLTIIGDGPQRSELEEEASKRNLSVIFLGRLGYKDALTEIARHDLYIHTSTKESFSFSLLEAKLCGLATCAYEGLQVPPEFIDYRVADFELASWVAAISEASVRGPINIVESNEYSPKRLVDLTLNTLET